ncbi:hypothetical protein [Shimazuella kribbensis]|uniref:hypothetical protein n=1 Tax=Shimazuella kribbensis TaxID=139808 RepID=UPI00041ED6E8|nr:hypothetical protein [Shimazuella kribbensis]
MYHQYFQNLREADNILHEITELNEEYQRLFNKKIIPYEIMDSQKSNRKANLVIRMKPNHFMMNEERLFYSNEPYTVYYELPDSMAKILVSAIQAIQASQLDAVKHVHLDTNIGKYTFSMTGGADSYDLYDSDELNDIACWFKKGW